MALKALLLLLLLLTFTAHPLVSATGGSSRTPTVAVTKLLSLPRTSFKLMITGENMDLRGMDIALQDLVDTHVRDGFKRHLRKGGPIDVSAASVAAIRLEQVAPAELAFLGPVALEPGENMTVSLLQTAFAGTVVLEFGEKSKKVIVDTRPSEVQDDINNALRRCWEYQGEFILFRQEIHATPELEQVLKVQVNIDSEKVAEGTIAEALSPEEPNRRPRPSRLTVIAVSFLFVMFIVLCALFCLLQQQRRKIYGRKKQMLDKSESEFDEESSVSMSQSSASSSKWNRTPAERKAKYETEKEERRKQERLDALAKKMSSVSTRSSVKRMGSKRHQRRRRQQRNELGAIEENGVEEEDGIMMDVIDTTEPPPQSSRREYESKEEEGAFFL